MSDAPESFESRLSRLQEVVGRLESGDLPLEESVALFKEGLSLAKACRLQLETARNEVAVYQDGLLTAFTAPIKGEKDEKEEDDG